ncbi:MAG: UDP-N-acetylmuramoyl-L-alanyl-D-glutamate--2,6-diaminopimelate ligase [Patescibacteria group bacterium]|nr:UDP-N-acetylmuramoyl-L-alanyl-D-glutamate--2,6-diaminopimelate ligase [Patescibacteria group bacterium]
MDSFLYTIKKFIPRGLFAALQPAYHYTLALLGAILWRFPSRKLTVVAVTGTKGKTSTIELISAILEEAGYTTALSSTLRFKIGNESENNTYKMTLPGRFFLQKFLRRAVAARCQYAIVELTSEGAKQFRHKFVALDALVFTNLTPEHIESHGSFENYLDAKLSIARALAHSSKKRKVVVANADDAQGEKFLNVGASEKYPYSLHEVEPYSVKKEGVELTIDGTHMTSKLSGEFNIYNILAAATLAKSQGVGVDAIKRAVEKFSGIPGRMERVDEGQDFTVVIDYAHTADSLEKVYEVFAHSRSICVLGSTGGGRDKWKRPEMGTVASRHCSHIILTNEDPYDEDPLQIIEEIAQGITRPIHETIINRREAIKTALQSARTGDTVLITGKGTDPYIMGPNNTKLAWSDAGVAREELKNIMKIS